MFIFLHLSGPPCGVHEFDFNYIAAEYHIEQLSV